MSGPYTFTKNEENLRAEHLEGSRKGGPRQAPRLPPLKHITECT